MAEDKDPIQEDELSNVSGFVLPRKEIIAIAAAAAAAAIEAVLDGQVALPTAAAPAASRRLSIPEWETYDGFRTHMQALEQEWGPKGKTVMAGHAGVTLRTLERRMAKFNLDVWPPSKWPRRQPRKLRSVTHGPATLAAALPMLWSIIDVLFDGRLDGAVRAACVLVGHTVRV